MQTEEPTVVHADVDDAPLKSALADTEPESLADAVRIVIRAAIGANGLIHGLSEVTRAMDRRTVHMCFLAADCDDEEYKKLVVSLAQQNAIDLVEVESTEELAGWVGLCRKVAADKVKKVPKCSCVAIRDFGERTRALEMLLSKLHH